MRLILACLCLLLGFYGNPVLAQDGPVYPRPNYLYNPSSTIAEDQVFAVKYNIPVDEKSLQENSYCNIQGLGERVGTRIINGQARYEILDSLYISEDQFDSESIHLLQCKRLLPNEAKVELIFGPGIESLPDDNKETHASKSSFKYGFQVRDKFKADFSCTRSNSNAPCSPLHPVRLNFSSPIEKKHVPQIVLSSEDTKFEADQLKSENTDEGLLSSISFAGPFPENTELKLVLPADIEDEMGRKLSNAASFPLNFEIASLPPLVKFSTGDFGIIERFANGAPAQDPEILLPVAVRKVGDDLLSQDLLLSAGKVSDHVLSNGADVINWLSKVKRLQSGQLTTGQFSDVMAARPMRDRQSNEPLIDVRSRSIFADTDELNKLDLPGMADLTGPDIEMVGIPLADPGLHIIEVASPELGASLLEDKAGNEKMYVRTAVLVSNLAVHIKTGRDDVLAWVTTLDDGKPVADADIQLFSCDGELLSSGKTDANGIWHEYEYQDTYQYCDETNTSGLLVTANIGSNHPMAYGKNDFSFAWTSWDRGIEPWRFNIPYSNDPEPDLVAHAVLDRSLLHTDETVSMKIFVRELNRDGLSNPGDGILPDKILISHAGSGEEFKVPVKWTENSGGGVYALADFKIEPAAKLGEYAIQIPLPTDNEYWQPSLYAGSFRVESFKLPLLTGSLKINAVNGDDNDADILVNPEKIQADMQLSWISGGVAANIETDLSAVSRPLEPYYEDYADFRFTLPRSLLDVDDQQNSVRRLILDKQKAKLGEDGATLVEVADLPKVDTPQNWLFEMSFKDPNGQIQTIAQTKTVWPADLIIGIESGRWFNAGSSADVKLLVLDKNSKPVANTQVQLDGRQSTTYSTRKRLVGGFYAYDSHEQIASLGTLCQGKTDADGIFTCPVKLSQDGEVQLIAKTKDENGRTAKTGASIWVWGDSAWFGSENNDRIDVIPNKSSYKPGEVAELTVRTPFNEAQALVSIEREGVLSTEIHEIKASDPIIKIPIKAEWSPNVFVSVLAVRGRLREIPWSSFFDWGWHSPKAWLAARNNQTTNVPVPTATVDLAKPAYRFGITELNISDEADRLQVKLSTDKDTYQIRETAKTKVQVDLPDGKPAAGANVAFAAVDEALLELFDNNSWDLLSAMRNKRSYGVSTATAQGEVVGRRHYGRKAIPAGGGGGHSITRELFDTLLLWRGDVVVDANGQASIDVPINDSISKFRLVAIADYGQDSFGTGMTDIISTQDLQLVSGLPQIVRENDKYQAELTVRNRSKHDMSISLNGEYEYPKGKINAIDEKEIQLAAGQSETLQWQISVPELDGNGAINWWFDAKSEQAADAIKISQELLPKIPIEAFAADLLHLKPASNQHFKMSVPEDAIRSQNGEVRGGVNITLQASLAGSMPGVYDWFKAYPYTCIEQQSAKYIGMQDHDKWQQLMHELPKYQTDSGLLSFFPETLPSVVLTAQFVEIAALAEDLGWAFDVPRRAKSAMASALQDYVYGRLQDSSWPNLNDDIWLKIIAVNALLKADGWQNGMLDSLYYDPSDWPTAALVTWVSILQSVPEFPDKQELLKLANDRLKTRIKYTGTTAVLADESIDQGWWLMSNQTTAQARFLLLALESDYWRDDLPLIFNGLLSLQRNGHWQTTSANVLGVLAVNAFSQQQENDAGQGAITLSSNELADVLTFDWQAIQEDGSQSIEFAWPDNGDIDIELKQNNTGSGWASLVSKAAIDYQTAQSSGISIERNIIPISQANPDYWSVGDIYRVKLKITAEGESFWAALSDPVPAGASILGTGLGRDSAIASQDESDNYWDYPSYVERDADTFRAYYEYLSPGEHTIEYTVRLNNVGDFNMPPTRVQALYQADVFGALPNQPINVKANE